MEVTNRNILTKIMEHCELEIKNNLDSSEDKLNKITEIDAVDIEKIDYNTFFTNYLLPNLPCVIKNVSSNWECNKNWIINNKINYDFLISKYGEEIAPVADCNCIDFNSQCKIEMKVREFMNYLQEPNVPKLLYLKDWHLKKAKPADNFYLVPFIFAADWLNEFALDNMEDDFMFVYIGPSNSWTPLHADVYNSFSWSVNIIGKKKWLLFPPKEEEKLKDSLGNLPILFEHLRYENVKYFEIIQEKGDALFVPSGWHHQVVNLEDTISINHNWINACNLESVWNCLQENLSNVEKEISDLRDSPEYFDQCQLILKNIFGMDLNGFVNLLCHIANKRLLQHEGTNQLLFGKYKFGDKHLKYDIKKLSKVFDYIFQHHLLLNNCIKLNIDCNIQELIHKIKSL